MTADWPFYYNSWKKRSAVYKKKIIDWLLQHEETRAKNSRIFSTNLCFFFFFLRIFVKDIRRGAARSLLIIPKSCCQWKLNRENYICVLFCVEWKLHPVETYKGEKRTDSSLIKRDPSFSFIPTGNPSTLLLSSLHLLFHVAPPAPRSTALVLCSCFTLFFSSFCD